MEYRKVGESVRFITLLVPFGSEMPDVDISGLQTTSGGFRVTIDVDGRREYIRATSSGVTITNAP